MKIEKDKVVSVLYDLREENHESAIVEGVGSENPLQFIFGNGMMLPSFEANLKELSKGDKFQFKLVAAEAYGEFMQENIVNIPKTSFEVENKIEDGLLTVDNIIPLQDEKGNKFNGRVMEVMDTEVKIDFNHPMAGKDLYFTGSIFDVRDASKEELEHGHVHGPEGHNH